MSRLILALAFTLTAAAQDIPVDALLKELGEVRTFSTSLISPDGQQVLYSLSEPRSDGKPGRTSALYLADAKPGTTGRKVSDSKDGATPAWSPDSRSFVFVAEGQKEGERQVWLHETASGKTRSLISVKGLLGQPKWSPDGKRLAVLYTADAKKLAGPTQAVAPATGVIEDQVDHQRLAILDVNGKSLKPISPADMYVYEYDWSPDGTRFALTAAPGPGDDNWFIAKLYTLSAEGGALKQVFSPGVQQQLALPRWSPKGDRIAFIAGLMSDEGSTGGEIYLVGAAGGEAKDLTPGFRSTPAYFTWLPDGDRILFTEHIGGGVGISQLNTSTGETERMWKADESIGATGESTSISLSRDGKSSALVRQSFSRAPEVWTGRIGDWQPLTSANASRKPHWGEAKNLQWKNGTNDVQGWLIQPVHYDPNRRYPMVVVVHGGPAAKAGSAWPTGYSPLALAEYGFFVFEANPRGSFGQGERFTTGNVKDFGGGDLKDIMAGVDTVLKSYPVDENRLGIFGWSYGGYMTMWTVTQTNRFHAAVAGAGIANWQSYYGENAIDRWMIPFFGASVYDDPAVYAKSSPITYIKNVKTPTLVLVGERDGECPAPQSFEFWHALKTLGVKTQLVVYPGEGHGIRKPEHQQDLFTRLVGWFRDNLAQ